MWKTFTLSALALSGVQADECSISDGDRVDCGYVGVTESECENKGCCWSPTDTNGAPWCFYKNGASTSCFLRQETMETPFTDSEVATMRGFFLDNINIDNKGGIVAAPDYDTPGGSYYYHWMRDGALTMRCFQETANSFDEIEDTMKSYTQWVLNAQVAEPLNGQDVRTEPKFMLPDGGVFTGSWCRPQNDGPGLRAISLMIFAQSLIDNGQMDYVQKYLWTSSDSSYNGGAIKFDLDYVVSGYNSNTCDLWEEIRSSDMFWNRITMKKSLLMGQDFAQLMGDDSTAVEYKNAMYEINATLYDNHWTGSFVSEDVSRPQDTAVIVGFNDGFDGHDKLFAPTSMEVAKTVASYNTLFCNEYSVNVGDTSSGIPGVLYGRYGGDSYAGGNPWVLSTAALAQLFYRAASYTLSQGLPDSEAMSAWATALNLGETESLPQQAEELAEVFAAAGDGVLLRLRSHVQSDGWHLNEQLDRNTGDQMAAENLTWSYAEVLNAMHQRNLYITAKNAR